MEDTLEGLAEQTQPDTVAASLPQEQDPTGLRTELVRAFLEGDGADCDFVVFTLAGTLLTPSALQRIAAAFVEFPNAHAVYADLELQGGDGSVWPLAFPAFDYERMLEQGYCAYLFALPRMAVDRSLEGGASNLYRVFNSILDDASHADIVHLPGPLGTLPEFDHDAATRALATATNEHLQAKDISAQVTLHPDGLLPAVHVTRAFERPRTTIIIPTRNRKRSTARTVSIPSDPQSNAPMLKS